MSQDPLAVNDLEVSRRDPPALKLAQALDMMETGIRLKRAVFASAQKQATSQQLDELMKDWLFADG